MGRKPKSAEVRARFFTARATGATLKQAVATAGESKTTGHYWLTQSGAVPPQQRRARPPLRLSLEERETISRGLAQKKTLTAITAELGRSTSTVSGEVARNGGPNGYRAARGPTGSAAQVPATAGGSWPRIQCCAARSEYKLRPRWSPQQISRRLIIDFPTGCLDAGLA